MKTAETSLMLPNGRTRSPFRYERCCDVYQISPGGATGTKPPSVILKHLSVIPAKAGIQGSWRGPHAPFPHSTPPGFPLSRE